MGTVVVGLDGSEASQLAFAEAVRQAQWRDGAVRAVHVYPYPVSTPYQMTVIDPEVYRRAATEWMARELDSLEERYEGRFPVEVDSTVAAGHSGVVLVDAARDADVLVLGSRGLGGFRGLLLGSVTTYCVHHLSCPVLVVPAPASDDT